MLSASPVLSFRAGSRRIHRAARGFSLIEMLIAIAMLGILLTVGLPSYANWLQNAHVRTAAESIRDGLQLARAEAVRRNAPVRFQLTSGGVGLSDWNVAASSDAGTTFTVLIQSRSGAEGSTNARVGVSAAAQPSPAYSTALTAGAGLPASVVFNQFGQSNAGITRVDVTNAAVSAENMRRLVLLVSVGGRIRMCDPRLVLANNPQGCA